MEAGISTSASTSTPEDNVFVTCAAVFVFSGNETSLAALFPPLAVLSTEEAAALSAVGAFPTSAFVHADNAMQSTKVTKISFFISIHSFGGHTAPFCPNYTRLTLPCLDFCKSFAVNLHFACNACISPKSGPFGQQKRRPNRIQNAVQPPKFYILIIAYNF